MPAKVRFLWSLLRDTRNFLASAVAGWDYPVSMMEVQSLALLAAIRGALTDGGDLPDLNWPWTHPREPAKPLHRESISRSERDRLTEILNQYSALTPANTDGEMWVP